MSKVCSRDAKTPSGASAKSSSGDPRLTEWKNFFLDSGIPEHAASEYAGIFVKERINWAILKNLDKGYLTDMGINTIGDQISILQAAKRYSGEQYAPGSAAVSTSVPKSFTLAPLRMDTEEALPSRTVSSTAKPVENSRHKPDISFVGKITAPEPPVTIRTGKSEVSSTAPLRSIVKTTGDSRGTVILVRSKRPVEEDDKERAIVKRLSALPPKQVRAQSPQEVMFNVRLGAGPSAKRDVFSRLTPKGVKTSGNTNLVHVLESKMSRLSTAAPVQTERDKPVVATLVSDAMETSASPSIFNRLGSGDSNVRSRIGLTTAQVPAVSRSSSSSSTVFSRLGFAAGNGRSQNGAALPPGDLRQRLNVKDRLGVRR
ncbi:uncharacterized protein LOC129581346 [Paramacrobiotus metropolitanus]|uniref:uncharacterized protein LOC129581346 n=1 Tax=Paramacrobiotus metropolitanus TaxID=2943436 RepID=UPI002446282C|nr:uncharacterized protein LOC129581346 [Paramacrobiotus metropolitanus]